MIWNHCPLPASGPLSSRESLPTRRSGRKSAGRVVGTWHDWYISCIDHGLSRSFHDINIISYTYIYENGIPQISSNIHRFVGKPATRNVSKFWLRMVLRAYGEPQRLHTQMYANRSYFGSSGICLSFVSVYFTFHIFHLATIYLSIH